MATNTTILYSDASGYGISWSLPQGFSYGQSHSLPPHMVMPSDKEIRLADLIADKIHSTRSLNTRRGYESFYRYFTSRYKKGPLAGSINQQFIDSFARGLEEDFPESASQKNLFIVRLSAVIKKATMNGLTAPLHLLNFPKYRCLRADHDLSEREISIIYGIYKRLVASDPELRCTETLAAAVFIIDIAFQGLAPVDLAALKISDIKFLKAIPEGNRMQDSVAESKCSGRPGTYSRCIEAILIDTFRKKTGVPVRIVAALEPIKHAVMPLVKGKRGEDYLIPCFDSTKTYTPEQRQSRLANHFHKLSVALNRTISDHYLANGLGEARNTTYYFARHAFCNLADSLDLPRHIIQKLVGHRQTVLERSYLRAPTLWEQAQVSLSIFKLMQNA